MEGSLGWYGEQCDLYDHGGHEELHAQVERSVLISVTGGHGIAAAVLCSQGCWANSCCKTLFLFTVV